MTNPAQNPSTPRNTTVYIDSATLHLDGAKGLLMLLQNTLEPRADQLSTPKAVGIMATVQSLIDWTHTDLEKDSQINGHDWTTATLWLDGITGALQALSGGYLSQYDLPNNRIQIAAIHSLQTVIGEAIDHIESIWAVTREGSV